MKLKLYLEETYNELVHKDSWPSWSELESSAIVVMIASLLFALTIFAMDSTFQRFMDFLYSMFY